MKYIGPEFETYREQVIPADAPPVQVRECQLAFHAGAHALFQLLMRRLDPDQEPTDSDLQMMHDIECELKEFGADVGKGRG